MRVPYQDLILFNKRSTNERAFPVGDDLIYDLIRDVQPHAVLCSLRSARCAEQLASAMAQVRTRDSVKSKRDGFRTRASRIEPRPGPRSDRGPCEQHQSPAARQHVDA